jgi:folate-binding protein YgfZ
MLSNDVAQEHCEALLLTPKARVIAPLRVWRRTPDDFLLLTEPELGETVRATLLRARFAAKCEVALAEHTSTLVLGDGDGDDGIPNEDYGVPARELLDVDLPVDGDVEDLERLRIEARTPRWGREVDDRVLPAEAGLTERAVSFTKGCYPGQEPIARLHYRGHANRSLRVVDIEGDELPEYDEELTYDGKVVGRITSSVRNRDNIVALGYVRNDVPEDAPLVAKTGSARLRPLPSTDEHCTARKSHAGEAG